MLPLRRVSTQVQRRIRRLPSKCEAASVPTTMSSSSSNGSNNCKRVIQACVSTSMLSSSSTPVRLYATPASTATKSAPTQRRALRFWPASLSTAAVANKPSATAAAYTHSYNVTASSPPPPPSHLYGRGFTSLLQQQIAEAARQPQQGVSLAQLLSVGPFPTKSALLASAKFLHKELPVRLAKRVKELESLPYGLSQMAPVLKVKGWYEESFRELVSVPEPKTEAEERAFTDLLAKIYQRHSEVVPTLAAGVVQMKLELGASGNDVVNQCPFLQDFLNRFHSSRIGIRILIAQHLALHEPVEGFIGTIATSISPVGVIKDAISDATQICDREYGWAPDVEVLGEVKGQFNFVPTHLHHICFELLKNSMRAVVDLHGDPIRRSPPRHADAPPIHVVISEDASELTVKVSDQGGGIPKSDMHRIWSYLYTTNKQEQAERLLERLKSGGNPNTIDQQEAHPTNAVGPQEGQIMYGFGYGLPISRITARYFGGDIEVVSAEGYGTDTYCYLPREWNLLE